MGIVLLGVWGSCAARAQAREHGDTTTYVARDEVTIAVEPASAHFFATPYRQPFPAEGLMVPAFPVGTVLVAVEPEEGAALTVTDLRCPPGFSDCLECNRRWAVWNDDGPHARGWREVRALGDADIDEPPRLPPLGIYEPLVGASGEFLGAFESAFDPWPTPVTPHAEYLLVDERGVFGSVRHVWSEPLCGFIYDCWYGVRKETWPRPGGGGLAVGPFDEPPGEVEVVRSDWLEVEVVVDGATLLQTHAFPCSTISRRGVGANHCARGRLETEGRILERVIGREGGHHTHPVELCRRELYSGASKVPRGGVAGGVTVGGGRHPGGGHSCARIRTILL